MARPTDWSPLADSDPVPGDPQRISEQAAHLASAAQRIQGQVSQLRAIAAGQSDERGLHVDKLKSASSDVAGSLEKVVGRYQKTSSALSAWIPELEYAQSQSLKALYQAQDAAARERANQPIPWPSNHQPTAQDKQDDQARASALGRAADDLAAARAMLDAATSYRDQKGRETRNKIENAIHDGLADTWWDSHVGSAWAGFSDWVTEHADCLRTVANVASWIATGAGLPAPGDLRGHPRSGGQWRARGAGHARRAPAADRRCAAAVDDLGRAGSRDELATQADELARTLSVKPAT